DGDRSPSPHSSRTSAPSFAASKAWRRSGSRGMGRSLSGGQTYGDVTLRRFERYEGSVCEQDDVRALVARARDGDEAAWDALYRAVYPRPLPSAERLLSSPGAALGALSEPMGRCVTRIERSPCAA